MSVSVDNERIIVERTVRTGERSRLMQYKRIWWLLSNRRNVS